MRLGVAATIAAVTATSLCGPAAAHTSFGSPTSFRAADAPRFVAIVDLDRDGRLDAVVASEGQGVAVLRGDGAGGFGAPVLYAAGASTQGVAAGDLDGNGAPDVVAANRDSDNVSVLLNDGAGRLGTKTDYPLKGSIDTDPVKVALARVNGDAALDAIVLNMGVPGPGAEGDTVAVLLGTGTGAFGAAAFFPVGPASPEADPNGLAVADIDRDGDADVATSNPGSDEVAILLGDGAGGFAAPDRYPSQRGFGVGIGDFDGAGVPDLAVADFGQAGIPGTLAVRLGTGSAAPGGVFGPLRPVVSGDAPRSVAVGDLDLDGRDDIALTLTDAVSLVLATAAGAAFEPPLIVPVTAGSNPQQVALADLDSDTDLDLLVPTEQGDDVKVLLNAIRDPRRPVVGSEPRIRSFGLVPRLFRVGRSATPRVAAGSFFSYVSDRPAAARIRILRHAGGRRSGGRCRKPTRRNRKRRRCTRYVVVGSFRRAAVQGVNRHRFSGRIGRRALKPGRYRASLTATTPGTRLTSRPRLAGFRVLKARRRR